MAVSVVLLFCWSAAPAQYRIDRGLFNDGKRPDGSSGLANLKLPGDGAQLDPENSLSIVRGAFLADTGQMKNDTLGFQAGKMKVALEKPEKSATLAMLMSMVLPGAGQVYAHRYITIPIIWGFGYYFAKAWNDQNNRYHQWSDSVSASVQRDTLGKGSDLFRSIRDFYRDDRDRFAFYIAITYILNIVDAYVGASLYSFDVSENLGGSAKIRFRIPLR